MERLTLYYKSRKQYDIILTCDKHENEQREIMAINKLAKYENTGLEPSKIEKLKHDLAVYKIAFENILSDADEKINTIYRNDCCCSVEMENSQYYLDQAEEALKKPVN